MSDHFLGSKDFDDLERLGEEQLGFSVLDDGLGFHEKKKKQQREVFPFQSTDVRSGAEKKIPKKVEAPEMARPFERLVAFFSDIMIVYIVLLFTFYFNANALSLPQFLKAEPFLCLVYVFMFHMTYFVLGESLGGQTLGKALFEIRVVREGSYKPIDLKIAFQRFIFLSISFLFGGLGSLIAIWDSKFRTWHDRASLSLVRKEGKSKCLPSP